MKKTKKALASLAIASMVMTSIPFNALADNAATTRIFGNDRIQTAINVAKAGWTTANSVIVAPAADKNLVDALAAAPLAGQENAPILLTDGAALDAQTQQEITALGATKIFAVGALSDQVISSLRAMSGVNVVPLKGADRIETAAKIAGQLKAPAGTFVVGYGALADALSVASYAAANNYEILVTNPDGSLPSSEAPIGTKYVIGGPTLVNDVAGATRIYGQDRYDTNNQVIQTLGSNYDTVFVANGENAHLVDSLVASAYAAKTKSMIALTDNSSVKATGFLGGKMTASSKTIALGGEGVVSETVRSAVKAGATDVTPPPASGAVTVTGVATPGRSVANDEQLVKVATLNVSASDASTLTGMKIVRSGLSADSDIKSVVVYDGANRLNVPAVIGDSTADFNFTYPLQLTAGQTKSLDVYMNLNASASGKQIALTVQEVHGANVTGFTPFTSNVFSTADVDLGTLTTALGAGYPTANLDPNGQTATLMKYKFTADKEDVNLNRIVFTQNGSAGAQDIQDIELWNGDTKIAGPINLDASRTAAFALPNGLIVKNGSSVTLDLKAKVIGGAGRTVKFDIQDGVDVLGQGQTYGTSIVSNILNVTARNINEGSVIVSTDSTNPAASTVAKDTKDVVFGVAKVQALGEDIQLRKIKLHAAVTGVTTGSGILADLQNVKLISGDTTIGSSTDGFKDADGSGNIEIQLSKPLTINATTTAPIKLTADIKTTDWIANQTITMQLEGITEYARMTSGTTETTDTANLLNFNPMTIGDQGVTANQVAVGNFNIYAGQTNVVLSSFDLKQNLADKVNLNSLQFFNGSSTTSAATGIKDNGFKDFTNLKLEDTNGNVISDITATPSGEPRLTFNTPLAIDANATVRVNLVADVKSSTTTTSNYFGIDNSIDASDVVNGNDVNLKDGKDVSGGVLATVTTGSSYHLVQPVYSTYFDIDGQNTIMATAKDVKVGGWTIYNPEHASALAVTGSALSTGGVAYSNEMVTIKSIKVTKVASGNVAGDLGNDKFGNIRIVDKAGNVLGSASGFASGQTALVIDLDKPLDIDKGYTKSVDLAVVVDINASASDYGKGLELALGNGGAGGDADISATTKYTGKNADISFASVTSNKSTPADPASFTVAPATVAVANATLSNPVTSGAALTANTTIAKFTFTNNGTEAINVNQLKFVDTINTLDTTTAALTVYDASNGKALSAATTGGTITLNANSMRIDPGTSKSVLVRVSGNLAGFPVGGSIALEVVGDSSNFIKFSDYGVGGATTYILSNDATMDQLTVEKL